MAEAVDDFVSLWKREGDACWGLAEHAFEEGKALFAKLIGADSGEIATIENTSMGLSIAASLIAPPPGSNVVVDELTHQSNVYPWLLRQQVEIRYARADHGRVALSEFEALIDDNTAAVDVCHVTMGHGFRHDLGGLAELAHERGAYLVVDAAQSAGVVPIDVAEAGVDFLSCPTFKWLWGPLGAGFLYVRKELLKLGPPPLVGWMSARQPESFDIHSMQLHDDARRLQRGVHNGTGLVAALAGLRIVDELGADRIWEHTRELSRQLIEGFEEQGFEVLTPTGDEERGGLVAVSVKDAAAFNEALSERGILAGQYLPGQIRMDVALFHAEEDMLRTLEAFNHVASKGGLPDLAVESKEIIGYTDCLSVEPGDRIQFKISCESPSYRADIVRLIHGDPHPDGPGRKEEVVVEAGLSDTYPGRVQEIHAGSCVRVPSPSPLLTDISSFTLQAWIYPTLPDNGLQGLLTKWDAAQETGYGLFISAQGDLVAIIGDGSGAASQFGTGVELQPHRWYFVAVAYDADASLVRLHQQAVVPWASNTSSVLVEKAAGHIAPGKSSAPFLMAACWDGSRTVSHYDGKIESPTLFPAALSAEEIDLLRRDKLDETSHPPIGAWDFSQDISSSRVTDRSRNGLHGVTVNCPARGVTGRNWSGEETHWVQAPAEYGALHFHHDDLEDAGWETDFEWTTPPDLASGVYAARVTTASDEDRIPFFVKPKRGAPKADVVFLAPTLTYLAYSSEASLAVSAKRNAAPLFVPKAHEPIDQYMADNDMRSLYDRHVDGTGVYYATWRRPLTMRPDYYNRFRGYAHGLSADLHLLDWLEEKGVAYDVVTDHDLHAEGAPLLDPYRVVITGGHPEYWPGPMLEALEQYHTGAGRLMYVGGNGFFGVISIDPERPHIAEHRFVETNGFIWQAAAGEHYHSTTGEPAGNWRARGRSPHKLAGVSCTAVGSDQAMPYRRQPGSFDPRAAFIFAGIAEDEVIGNFGLQQGGAGGDEVDRMDCAQGSPPHALLLATASGYSDVYLYFPEDVYYDQTYPTEPGQKENAHPHVRADMVFYELPNGGAVFSTASITWCGALSHNNYKNNVSRITENVLRRFLEPDPFHCAEHASTPE